VFSFPDPVNEVAARLVATGVVALGVAILALDAPWLLVPLTYGFIARVASGPRFSPLALLVTKIIVPRVPIAPRPTPGPPKRFAQGIGVAFSTTAAILVLALDLKTPGYAVLGALVVAASLEAFAGLCLGCKAFALLMRAGVIPEEVCERCARPFDTAGAA
jgi:Domain of unknown function (DUF4395)